MNVKNSLRVFLAAACAVLLLSTVSCVYFNTMYNARKAYREAEEMEAKSDGQTQNRGLKDKYNEVVIKCSKILRDDPDSGWVDDALFLMGKSLVKQNDLGKGIRKFQELIANYPESEYVPHSLYWLALANREKRDYNQSLVYVKRFLDKYPDHEILSDVLFMAGDVNLELGNDQEALAYYSRAAENTDEREVMEEAVRKQADLHYRFKDWENAASSYSSLLRKGIAWQDRYRISLQLGECYVKTGRCDEALAMYDEILPLVTKVQDEGPIHLGRAASYACMDSTDRAMSVYESVTRKFPRSTFASEAFYRLGVIYHEQLDSLELAQESFEKSAQESSTSEFAPMASQKASSIKRLLELQSRQDGDNSTDIMAEKRFMAAEIQLTRLGETDNAMVNYRAVLDSFPDSRFAPMAAYAMGYVYQRQKGDSARAVESWRELVMRYPRSPQAQGALPRIKSSGFGEIAVGLQAYIDSAMADTAGVAEEMRRRRDVAVQDSLRLAATGQGAAGGPVPSRGTAVEPAAPPPAREDPEASRVARSGRFSSQMLKLIRRRKFDKMRREMWGDNSSPADSTSAGRT